RRHQSMNEPRSDNPIGRRVCLNTSRVFSRPRCPNCRAMFDAATSVDAEPQIPHPGALSVCASCAAILVFTENLYLREAAPDEIPPPSTESRAMLDIAIAA